MIINIHTEGSLLQVEQPVLAGGSAGMARVRFCTDGLWAGLALTAIFRTHRGDILMPLTNGECALPAEATAKCGDVLVGLFGSDGTRTQTSVFCRLRVSPGVPTEGEPAENYTPGLYEQFSAKFARVENMTADAVEGENAAVQMQEKDGALHLQFTLPKGKDGHTPEKGVDYFTEEEQNEFSESVLEELKKVAGAYVEGKTLHLPSNAGRVEGKKLILY